MTRQFCRITCKWISNKIYVGKTNKIIRVTPTTENQQNQFKQHINFHLDNKSSFKQKYLNVKRKYLLEANRNRCERWRASKSSMPKQLQCGTATLFPRNSIQQGTFKSKSSFASTLFLSYLSINLNQWLKVT